MPSSATITAYYTFTPSTKAKATQVNAMFSNLRGHHIPIDGSAASAADGSYHLGSDEHRWGTAFVNEVDLETSTSTASLVIKGNTAVTAGSMLFQIEGVTKAEIGTGGVDGQYFKASSIAFAALAFTPKLYYQEFTGNATWNSTSDMGNAVIIYGFGGGGGGGGGCGTGSGVGGWGGDGAPPQFRWQIITPGNSYSVTVGAGGGGGSGTTGAYASGGQGGTGSISVFGSQAFRGGVGGVPYSATALTVNQRTQVSAWGGIADTAGQTSQNDKAGGAAGTGGTGTQHGGGGGGGPEGVGGTGGAPATAGGGVNANSGAGGGGAGATAGNGAAGGAGGSGYIVVIYTRNS